MRIYTGIGSRRTPKDILNKMENLGFILAKAGFTLRSGGADGADLAFENGCDRGKGVKEIYLPWKNFNNNQSSLYHISNEAINLAKNIHPKWSNCSNPARKMHSRNGYQVLGPDLNSPTNFVLYWSDGSGGTEQAIRICKKFSIPHFNMRDDDWDFRFRNHLFHFLKS